MVVELRVEAGSSLCFLLVFLTLLSEFAEGCPAEEREALSSFGKDVVYHSGTSFRWSNDTDCCRWFHVGCNGEGHVVWLEFSSHDYHPQLQLRGTNTLNPSLQQLRHLEYLVLSGIDFGGALLPEFIGSFRKLWNLDLSGCHFSGPFPVQLGNLDKLTYLDLSHWDFSQSSDWAQTVIQIPSLSDLVLEHCSLPSSPPTSFINSSQHLSLISLTHNHLSWSSLSPWLFNVTSQLEFLYLSYNKLEGSIPEAFGNMTSLGELSLDHNLLQGVIPASLGNLCLQRIDMSSNNLSGDLGDLFRNLSAGCLRSSLFDLDLSENRFTGSISGHVTRFSSLNRLSTWIGKSLIFLSLRANKFTGSIPLEICKLKNIHILDFAMNGISGTIPRCLDEIITMTHRQNLTSLLKEQYEQNISSTSVESLGSFSVHVTSDYIYNAFLVWQGKVNEYSKILGYLILIDVSDNMLIGEIPMEMAHLLELVALNLSRNHLSGIIPMDFGKLRNLQVVDLSKNRLSGGIPHSMSEMTFLSRLDLSYNNLSGKIPTSTQILGFDPSWFTGNPALCGLPVKIHCPGDDDVPDPPKVGETDEDEFHKCFYIGIGIGSATGFWLTCGALLVMRPWRHAYFRFLDELGDRVYVTFLLRKRKLKTRLQR